MTVTRARWAAIGAAVAVTLGAGGVTLGQAAINSGSKPVFVAVTPCRLVDTRPNEANVGSRSTPLGGGDTLTLQVTGSPGECTGVPADAVAVAMNVTAIQGSTRSFLTVYPGGTTLPNASNLNWNGGDPPTPNKVDVKLSNSGSVSFTNDAGTVHIAADLVGYYVDHTHDDRYYTKAQLDAARQQTRTYYAAAASVLNGKPMWPVVNCMTIGPVGGTPAGAEQGGTMVLPIDVPAGSTVTAVSARMRDGGALADYTLTFQRLASSVDGVSAANLRAATGGTSAGARDIDLTPVAPAEAAPGDAFAVQLSLGVPADVSDRDALCSVTVTYTLPTPDS